MLHFSTNRTRMGFVDSKRGMERERFGGRDWQDDKAGIEIQIIDWGKAPCLGFPKS
jgi:hypothetical protein